MRHGFAWVLWTGVTVSLAGVASAQTSRPAPGRGASRPVAPKPAGEQLPNAGAAEVKSGGSWKPAIIKQRDGELFLVAFEGWEKQFFWEWVTADCVRAVGSDKQGPEHAQGVKVGNQGVAKAKAEARKRLGEAKKKQADAEAMESVLQKQEGELKLAPADASAARDVTPADADVPWTFAAPAQGAKKVTDKPVRLAGGSGQFFERAEEMIVTALPAGFVFVAHVHDPPGDEFSTRLEKLDVSAGKSVKTFNLPRGVRVLDVSPAGARAVGRGEGAGSASKDVVYLFNVAGELKHELSFKPFAPAGGTAGDAGAAVEQAWLADEARLLTVGGTPSRLVAWDLADPAAPKAIWSLQVSLLSRPELIAGGKGLKFWQSSRTFVVDTATGQLAGALRQPAAARASAISPDGRRLAVARVGWVEVIELATGKALQRIAVSPAVDTSGVRWLDETYVLLGGRHLADVTRGYVLWRYAATSQVAGSTGAGPHQLQLVREGAEKPSQVVIRTLPDEAARKAAANLKDADIFAIKPGTSVSLDVKVQAPPDVQQAIRDALAARLMDRGYRVAEKSSVRLVAETANGEKPLEIDYTLPDRSKHRRSILPLVMNVGLEVDADKPGEEKPLWITQSVHTPPLHFPFKPGDSLDAKIEESRVRALDWFKTVDLPERVQKFQKEPGFGQTELR